MLLYVVIVCTVLCVNSWSVAEKKRLLQSLQTHGIDQYEAIQKDIPARTITEIRYVCGKYMEKAIVQNSEEAKRADREAGTDEQYPINQWIRIFKDNLVPGVVDDVIPRVLKYIALFEDRPEGGEINFRELYLFLSEACYGNVSRPLDPATNEFLYKNLHDMATMLKNKNLDKEKGFLRNIETLAEKPVKTYGGRKRKAPKDVNPVLNPLKIPEELLQLPGESGVRVIKAEKLM